MSSPCSMTGSPTSRRAARSTPTAQGNPQGAEGLAVVPAGQEEATIESAEECPGECIFIEVDG